jgi:2,3-bisphosphoglycerate-independent phosphoglycerate mutase
MAKKSGVGSSGGGERGRGGATKPPVMVRDSRGNLHPFLRGMVTHDLVQRGLSFDDAYSAARAVRDRIGGREEVSTSELKDVLEEQLVTLFGWERAVRLFPPGWPSSPEIEVLAQGQGHPFSRGVLARSLQAAGVDLDRAYRLVTELQGALLREGVERLTSDDLARRVGETLERYEGPETAARYRLMGRIRHLPRPLVIYLGGATGTGKSTLALEIAPLLRIYRVTATDTIRQVMRTLLAPAILPAIHTSSFEAGDALAPGYAWGREETFEHRLAAGFREQATRVCVGVRAVVERAILENMSVVVEGVHLAPPMVPFGDLEGAVHQVSLMLTTLSEDTHRLRFLSRARSAPRSAERYVDRFEAIRALQSHLAELAEAHDVALLDTTDGETALARSLRLITGVLEERLPWLGRPDGVIEPAGVPTLLVVIDGVADQPVRALGGKTPLEAADKPNLDRLAREGQTGIADPIGPGVVPDTAAGTLALFGQSPTAMARGPVEALGSGLRLETGDVVVRGNFATLDKRGKLVDRRAGRIREQAHELAVALDRPELGPEWQGHEVRVMTTTEHRLAIVLRGPGLSAAILGSDPGDGRLGAPPPLPRALDSRDAAAVRTAKLLAHFERLARRILAAQPANARRRARREPLANAVLTRGAGRVHRLARLAQDGTPLRHATVSGDRTVLGLAAWLGGEPITAPELTANLDTDIELKFQLAAKALAKNDLVLLHLKGADIAAHDQRPDLKVKFIERVDRALGDLLEAHEGPLRVAVASDHATLSEGGYHAADPVPVLIWGPGIEADEVGLFDEASARHGALKRFPLQLLLGRLFEIG